MTDPERIVYRTLAERERQGLLGALSRTIASRPIASGLVGGLSAVGIAFARAHEGALRMPIVAALISAAVVAVWIGLFWLMRRSIGSMATHEVEVVRALQWSEDELTWREGEAVLRHVRDPRWSLVRAPGEPRGRDARDTAWPVFLIVDEDEHRDHPNFVLESRMSWDEAVRYPIEQPSSVDEKLPPHVATKLLSLARRDT